MGADEIVYTLDGPSGAKLHAIDPTGASPVEKSWSPLAVNGTALTIAP